MGGPNKSGSVDRWDPRMGNAHPDPGIARDFYDQ
jgi:hypothetical protein